MSAHYSSKFLFRLGLIVFLVTLMIYWVGGSSQAASDSLSNSPTAQLQISQLQQAQCFASGQARTSKQASNGLVRFMGTNPGQAVRAPIALPANATAETAARGYLSACGSLFGIKNQATDLQLSQQQKNAEGHSITRFQQRYQGVPVLGGETLVQTDPGNNIVSVASKTETNLALATQPSVSAATAQATALQLVASIYKTSLVNLVATTPELWIYSPSLIGPENKPPVLVWRIYVTTKTSNPLNEMVLVDAQRGIVIVNLNQADGALQLRTYTANDTTSLPGTLVCTEADPTCSAAPGDSTISHAHQYAADFYNYFFNNFGRDSLDGHGMPITSTVHYSSSIDIGTVWNGSEVIYSDWFSYTLAEDLVGHELNHGVIQYTSKLFDWYQSGAIAESMSDVFGQFMRHTYQPSTASDWRIGAEVTGAGPFRNMADPTLFLDPDIITSTNYYNGQCVSSTDNCDNGYIHENAGVGNKAAYLLTVGGTFNGQTISALGMNKVAHIYYKVETELLLSGSDWGNLYDALYQGCLNLVGQDGIVLGDCTQVRNATIAVAMNQTPPLYDVRAPVCDPGLSPTYVFSDGLESGSTNWAFGALSGVSRWGLDSNPINAYGGSHSLYANDSLNNAQVSKSYAAMVNPIAIPANAFLYFDHDYEFDYDTATTGNDGGVVEYSLNGITWFDWNAMTKINGYNGQITGRSLSNPLHGQQGFIDSSHGYTSSRADLSSLSGKNVQFRFVMGTDSSVYNHGWWIDNIGIYTCAASAAPGAFGKTSPTQGATGVSRNPTLSWGASTEATSYDYCVNTTSSCNTWTPIGTAQQVRLYNLVSGQVYYWQVRANNTITSTLADGGTLWQFTGGWWIDLPLILR